MEATDFTPKLSPRFLVYLRSYLLDKNIDPLSIFQKFGLEESSTAEYAIPLPTSTVIDLIDEASIACEDSLLGFNMATHFHYESSALIVLAMLAAPNVEQALLTLCHFDRYVDTGITSSLEISDDVASFSVELLGVDSHRALHLNEYLLSFVLHTLNIATRKELAVKEVHFQHCRKEGSERIDQFFGVPAQYHQSDNRLCFSNDNLQQSMLSSNELLYEVLIGALKTYFYADSREMGFVDAVCRELMLSADTVESEATNKLDDIAAKLAISTRTLRRRLKEEGYTFQSVKNLARERQAKYYLSDTNKSLSEIAFAVGFSELSAFSRAFKHWTGTSPQDYRNTVRKLMSA